MPAPTVVGTANDKALNTTPLFTNPAGAADLDLLLALIRWQSNTGTPSVLTPHGAWTLLDSQVHGAVRRPWSLYYRIRQAGDPANWSHALDVSAHWIAGVLAIRGYHATWDEEHGHTADAGDSVTIMRAPSRTSLGADRLLVCGWMPDGTATGTTTSTPVGSMAEKIDNRQSNAIMINISTEVVGTGATGTRDCTLDAGSMTEDLAFSLLIAPADEAAGGVRRQSSMIWTPCLIPVVSP